MLILFFSHFLLFRGGVHFPPIWHFSGLLFWGLYKMPREKKNCTIGRWVMSTLSYIIYVWKYIYNVPQLSRYKISMTIFLENPLGMQWLMFSKISECFTRNTIDKILKHCEEIVFSRNIPTELWTERYRQLYNGIIYLLWYFISHTFIVSIVFGVLS